MNHLNPDTPHAQVDAIVTGVLNGELPAFDPNLAPEQFVERARQHGVTALLHRALNTYPDSAELWPEALREAVAADTLANAASDLLIEQELRRVLDALQTARIDSVLVKGAALAYSLYLDPYLRPRGDTDLYIAEKDKTAIENTLYSLGYRPVVAHGGGLISQQTTFTFKIAPNIEHNLDVHWHLFNLHVLADIMPYAEVYAQRTALPHLHQHAYGPGPVHGMLHACLHLQGHHGERERLIWLWDIKLLAETLTEPQRLQLLEESKHYGVTNLVRSGIEAARRAFAVPALQQLSNELSCENNAGRQRTVPAAHAPSIDFAKSDLQALPGWQQRVNYVWQHAVPKPKYMMHRYGFQNRFLLPWYYLRRWGAGAYKLFLPHHTAAYSARDPDSNRK